jgi:hypothetical protein
MSIIATLIGLVPSILSGIKEYVGKKQDLQKLRREAAVETEKVLLTAKIERARSADLADAELDKISLENTGWKDEYVLLLVTSPMVLNMISPFMDMFVLSDDYQRGMISAAVNQGFVNMTSAPEFYWWAVLAAVVHSFGMRRMLNSVLEKGGPVSIFTKRK